MSKNKSPLFRKIGSQDGTFQRFWESLTKHESPGKIDRFILIVPTADREALETLRKAEEDSISGYEAWQKEDRHTARQIMLRAVAQSESYTGFFEPRTIEHYGQLKLVAKCHFLLGVIEMEETEEDTSLKELNKAVFHLERFLSYYEVAEQPDYNDMAYLALVYLGSCFRRLGDNTLATTALVKATEFNADRPEAFLQLGRIYYSQRDTSRCRDAYENVLKLSAKEAQTKQEALSYLTWSVMQLRDWSAAEKYLLQAQREGALLRTFFEALDWEGFASCIEYRKLKSQFGG